MAEPPPISQVQPSFFPGMLIASTCLSMNFLSTKSRKSRLLEVQARSPDGQATPNGYSASTFLVCGCRTRCPAGVMSPQGAASQEPQLVPRGPLSPWTGFSKRTNMSELRIFSPIHRSHRVDLKHLTNSSLITRNRFCGLDSRTNTQLPLTCIADVDMREHWF